MGEGSRATLDVGAEGEVGLEVLHSVGEVAECLVGLGKALAGESGTSLIPARNAHRKVLLLALSKQASGCAHARVGWRGKSSKARANSAPEVY